MGDTNFCAISMGQALFRLELGYIPEKKPNSNQFHNILRLFNVLPIFPFTKSETIGDYYL